MMTSSTRRVCVASDSSNAFSESIRPIVGTIALIIVAPATPVKPEARTGTLRGPQFFHRGIVIEHQPVVRQCDLKLAIERQKRLQQILLVERESPFEQPLCGIVVREEDVMYVHPHARLEYRQHFEELVTDVTAELHGMTRVDEENVVRFELRKE